MPLIDDPVAASKLASLNRAAEAMSDIDQVLQRYQRFIATHAGTQAAQEAYKAMELWQDRKARGLIRIGGRWLAPEELDQLRSRIPEKIASVRQLLAAGQLRDAEKLLSEILELDSRNIAALYLSGLVQYQQDQLPQARRSFEAVNALIEGHAPTLNNLAVVNYRQNQHAVALNLFEQAMDAAPRDPIIIDNVAEALQALPERHRRGSAVERVTRKFQQQEAALAAAMRQKGLYRWGAGWVEKAQLDQLLAAEREVQDKIARYKAEFESLGLRAEDLARQIEDANRHLKRIEDSSYFVTTDGRIIRRPLPEYYYDERRRRDDLISERLQALARQKALREQADRVTQDLPVPKYTGVLRLIGDEGTPLAPSTQPS
ncbi:MAG: hypothetical protein RMJ35_08110 [Phycisphaerales bacterium]|nr:hypothetical protein [Phycisphaerales bacterium]